ncbi:hypothetical protein [Acrocarpospora phusangensis]|uniref:hypothetical protein n=1 Tax=Acrocarpospora phusangensis TaxID=1070424 RepID=UPI001951080B|nr:hypothetical protein [Acrocarpospora phusangensis]
MELYPMARAGQGRSVLTMDRLVEITTVSLVPVSWGVVGWAVAGWAGVVAGSVAGMIVTGLIALMIYRRPHRPGLPGFW